LLVIEVFSTLTSPGILTVVPAEARLDWLRLEYKLSFCEA
jgi:hypothetical protein